MGLKRYFKNHPALSESKKDIKAIRRHILNLKGIREEFHIPVVIVVFDEMDRLLLLEEPKKGGCVLPGGNREHKETFRMCAKRELKEETGIDIPVENFRR